ncbi:MAG: hypothetical protein E7256_15035 [Lachnospiraceae bacterium]|nr:hypothetical protein [Lachnospiraceae bacterium]
MVQLLYSWMKNIIIFMILVTVVRNLLGKSNYKKYVGLVTGMLLVILVVKPIINVLGNEELFDFSFHSYGYQVEAEDAGNIIFDMEGIRNDAIFEEYKGLLLEQTEKLLNDKGLTILSMDIVIDEDRESETFGGVQSMDISASYMKAEETTNVEKIKIDRITISGEEEEVLEAGKNISPMEINIKNLVADFYNIDSTNINISIREDHYGRE